MTKNNNAFVHEVIVYDKGIATRHYFGDAGEAEAFAGQYGSVRRQAFRIPKTTHGLAGLLTAVVAETNRAANRVER